MLPLSTRMRARNIDEFVGQEHFLYKGSLVYNAIKNNNFNRGIFFGASGTGKTTLARIIATTSGDEFVEINATNTGIKELKSVLEAAKNKFFGLEKQKTFLYIDEFHRWNKLQQDALLQALEEGVVKFIGSTTENPYFAINDAILSRVGNIYEFKRHSEENIKQLLDLAIKDKERGLGNSSVIFENEAVMLIAKMSNGDARRALDTLGFIFENLGENEEVTLEIVEEAMQTKALYYNKEEDKYNLLSALQKSIRGSDPDAAIHYLARLLTGGADINMIGRRLLVMASEDISLAYPDAINIAYSCVAAANMVGLPEAEINLAQCVIALASCPKSNKTYQALLEAKADIRGKKIGDVPAHLKDGHYAGAKKLGRADGYLYPHEFGGYVVQQYLPDNLEQAGVEYYHPTANGKEEYFKRYIEKIRSLK
ncbi:MAG: replication-associated recombination protein A [Eubacteriales bacterium]|nr:replication-associated recombination protein A [Eubacteriales bacterium]MDY3332610.1 replication-associated recombination protein A [Gallibacter sp.]